jgi:limonene 1,2-monooxygenase
MQDWPLRFGVFLPPMHLTGTNPTLNMRRCLELVDLLDRLGYEEVWCGEHHSAGSETIASPEVFIAAASQRTTRIKLGTGVNSLPYHHPFILADRLVMLDHLTEGRFMCGVGPGQLTSDALMLGIETTRQRPMMEEAFDVMMRLFGGETVTHDAGWFNCQEAVLQFRPYSYPLFDIAVASSISPSGPKLAGKYGAGMLSLAATTPAGFDVLDSHWAVAEESAAAAGQNVDRTKWRLMGPMYIAETVDQAVADTRARLKWVMDYIAHVVPSDHDESMNHDELVEAMNSSGGGVVGTPAMAIDQIERLIEHSGGFGAYLFLGADFAAWPQQRRSYELFAEEVMPHFKHQLAPPQASYDRLMAGGNRFVQLTADAQALSQQSYEAERATITAG